MHGPAFIPFGRGRPCILSVPAASGGPPRGDGPPSLACRACGPSGWFGAPPVGARGQKGPHMIAGLFGPSARPRLAVGGGVARPGPLLLSQPSRGPGWPPACAAAHSGLRGASAAALAFLKPRAPASRASPFFPFGALPARGVSACARGVKVGRGCLRAQAPPSTAAPPCCPVGSPIIARHQGSARGVHALPLTQRGAIYASPPPILLLPRSAEPCPQFRVGPALDCAVLLRHCPTGQKGAQHNVYHR